MRDSLCRGRASFSGARRGCRPPVPALASGPAVAVVEIDHTTPPSDGRDGRPSRCSRRRRPPHGKIATRPSRTPARRAAFRGSRRRTAARGRNRRPDFEPRQRGFEGNGGLGHGDLVWWVRCTDATSAPDSVVSESAGAESKRRRSQTRVDDRHDPPRPWPCGLSSPWRWDRRLHQTRERVTFLSAARFSRQPSATLFKPAGGGPFPCDGAAPRVQRVSTVLDDYAKWSVSPGYAAAIVDSFDRAA